MSPERDASCEGLRLAVSLAYLLARAQVEGLAAAGLARAERWKQGIAARARLASEDIAGHAGEYAEAAVAIPVGLALYILDPEHGAGADLAYLLRQLVTDLRRDR